MEKGTPHSPQSTTAVLVFSRALLAAPHTNTCAGTAAPGHSLAAAKYFAPCRREQCCQHLLSTSASPSGLQLTSPSLFTWTAVISKLRNILGENVFSCLDRSWSVKYCKKSCHSYLPLSVEQLLQSLRENNVFFLPFSDSFSNQVKYNSELTVLCFI